MPRVGIIGAGISGLVAAKTLLEEGFEVTVFETEDEVGGVWARARRYPGVTTQNPRDTYAFSDFPMPRTYPEFPSGEQVQAYLAAYADQFGVTPHVRFRTAVEHAAPRGEGWTVRSRSLDDDASRTETFDFLTVCNGTFSAPSIPEVPGAEAFRAGGGTILHSTGFNSVEQVRGRSVVVVGFGKSACDAAVAALPAASQTSIVYRHTTWKMPKKFAGLVPLKYILTTRFSEMLFRDRELRGAEKVIHSVGRPAVWLFWRGVEAMLRATYRLGACGMDPGGRIDQMVNCQLSLATDGFYEAVRGGRIHAHRSGVRALHAGAVELENGERVQADVVVFATGFRQEVPFLDASVRETVQDRAGVFHLYRNLMHPDVPRLAFVGYNGSLYSQLTSEIGARWAARWFMGELPLPPREAVLGQVRARWEWVQQNRPHGTAGGTCIVPFTLHYVDDLLRDMGARTVRRPLNRLREVMMPFDPSVYADLKAELDRNRARRLRASTPERRGLQSA